MWAERLVPLQFFNWPFSLAADENSSVALILIRPAPYMRPWARLAPGTERPRLGPQGTCADVASFVCTWSGTSFTTQCDWVRNQHNLIIVGPTGVGKSFLACALGDQACRTGYSVRYCKIPELLSDLLQARADGSLAQSCARFHCSSSMSGCGILCPKPMRARS